MANTDTPAYLTSDKARYTLGIHRGPLLQKNVDESAQLEQLAQVESAGGLSLQKRKLKKREKIQRHWKRFWCLHLFVTIIFLAILLPILFLVIIPAISQSVVNKSDLVLVNASVLNPRPDKIELTLLSALDLKLALPVRIDPITLDLYVRDVGGPEDHWGQAHLDGKVIRGNTTLGVNNVETPLTNGTTWESYVRNVVFKKETPLSVRGTTMSYLGVIKSKVTMDKDIMSPVLDQFKGFGISDSGLIAPLEDGTNLVGNASLPNPSVLTLDIGEILLDVKSGNIVIGNVTLKDVTLKPGPNVFPVNGILDISTMLDNIGPIIASQASAIKTGNLALDTVTRSVKWNNTLVPYYTNVMKDLTLTANVPIADLLKNTIHNLLNSNKKLSDVIGGEGGNLLGNLTKIKDNDSSATSSSELPSGSELASKLKGSLAARDIFRDAHPVKRDSIIDSLAHYYVKL
ncbi:uncharacterized protein N7515_004309 [Penicillium bovifimosum]|uniref:Uncharacterized protein n=1 Tax=Penicillium bovifimosum TaxID=126998 RepID=A0A9W9L3D0_9EURO|nr:uncharacterized protein N7515_004309 [Penicillium bovifimosum]KAJ5135031.1 hypothetical protein N7515_004309 [Penicillium bovifimosum]